MTNKFFSGLIPYYGGKQKLAKEIIRVAKQYSSSDTFIDCFTGGGSVSLMAKLYNYNVLTNDRSYASYQLAKALIENESITLSEYDIYKIYSYDIDYSTLINTFGDIKDRLKKHIIPDQHIDFILRASYINNIIGAFKNEYKKALINYLIIKYTISLIPYSSFRSNINKLANMTKYSTVKIVDEQLTPSIDYAIDIANKINQSIFTTNKKLKAYNLDVFDFIDEINPQNCIVYLDPPYYGEHTYEGTYNLLNKILLQKELESSVFNEDTWNDFFTKLLTKLKKNNLIIISYAGKAIEQMINLVKNVFNKADVLSYDYKYSLYAMKGKKHEVVKEYLIVAYEN